jgi:glycogen debranching enzyme
MADTITILDGSTFLVSKPNGDIEAGPTEPDGLFFKDTRHLSLWKLTVNGISLDVLSTDALEYYFAQFFCVPPTGTIYENPTVSIGRRRYVGDGFVEDVVVANHGTETRKFELKLEIGADFCDLFEVKDQLAKKGKYYRQIRHRALVLGYKRDDFVRETIISATVPPDILDEDFVIFRITVEPKQAWTMRLQVTPVEGTLEYQPKFAGKMGEKMRQNLAQWVADAPTVSAYPDAVRVLYQRSMVDIAALRFEPDILPGFSVPAAGLPWFMALFGRDSLFTSYQLLPFNSELASTSLQVLAARQGKVMDDLREEEPGRILHELRVGELTHFKERPQSPYFGASDTTPLFLVLLDEYERWTGDTELVHKLEPNIRHALEWIDKYGDSDGDGFIEYKRKTDLGLENQCWKDSWNSVLFSDGTVAKAPRALCEIQGYAYDAKVRTARLARNILNDKTLAEKLEKEAKQLKERFNKDFWIPERGFFAIALDGDKKKVDSLTSNIGHLLWSGIVEEDKVKSIVDHLMGPKLFSGWGVRTMAQGEGGFNPIEYHDGTVWPHDNSIIAAGLARYGYRKEAAKIIAGIMEASVFFNYRLPEVFAGYPRTLTGFPVRYPTASSPQAWAAGSPMLGLRVLLGLEPVGNDLKSDPVLPSWMGSLVVDGIPGRWGRKRVAAEQAGAPSMEQMFTRMVTERGLEKEERVA